MAAPTLLLPPLRLLGTEDPGRLADTPVWLVASDGTQGGTLGDWRGRAVALWLDPADVLLLQRTLPALGGRRLRQALPNAIEDGVAVDPASLHCTLGPLGSAGRRWIGAIPRAPIEALLRAMNELDIRVERISSPLLAQLGRPGGMCAWTNPADPGERRWAALIGEQALGGDAALGDSLGVDTPAVTTLPAPELAVWNLAADLDIDLPRRQRRTWAELAPPWLRTAPRFAALLLVPLALYVAGLGIETLRWSLEKRRLAAVPEQLFGELFPGQPVLMDPRLLLRHKLDELTAGTNPTAGRRQLLPLLDAAAQLRRQLPGQPLPASVTFAAGQLTVSFAAAPGAQPATAGSYAVRWLEKGREAIIYAGEGS